MVSDFNPEFSFDFGGPEEGRTQAAWEFSGESSAVYRGLSVPVTFSCYEILQIFRSCRKSVTLARSFQTSSFIFAAGALKEAHRERENDKTTSIDHKIAQQLKSKEQRAQASGKVWPKF